MRHVTLAFRTLFKTPFVTGIAVISLALGIGANAAIFSLFDQILLRPLPVPEPDRLVNLAAPGPKPGSQSCGQAGDCDVVFSYPMFRDLERSQTVFTGLAAHCVFGVSLSYRDQPTTGEGMYVSGSYFPTLGLRPALGRLLAPADDQSIATNYVAVLGYGYWQSHFGSDPGVLRRPLRVNGHAMTIVGVAPRDFHGTTLGIDPLVFVPISMAGVLWPGFRGVENRREYWAYLFARLKSGVSLAQASAGLNALYHPIITDVETPLQNGVSDQMMTQFRAKQVVVTPGRRGQSSMHRDAKAPLLMLLSVTAIVLLIACANIANLLLARGAGRAMDMGVRLALGAHRGQLITQLLTESVLLACLGALAGLLVAYWTLAGIATLAPPEVVGLALATGIVFGVFPAWHSTRTELVTTIRANAGQISGARSAARFRSSLVTVQIALATTLLIAAGLFVKSLVNVTRVDLGVQVDSVVTFRLAPERSGYDSTRALLLYGRVEDEVGAIPGVNAVTSSVIPLLAGSNWGSDVYVQGFPSGPDVDRNAWRNEIGAGYFAALGVRLRAGREFTPADHRGAPRVAVVNQAFVKKFNLGQGAVGKFMSIGRDSLNIQIVGVIPDIWRSTIARTRLASATQGHADADLARALGHAVGQDAVQTHRGEQRGEHRERCRQDADQPVHGDVVSDLRWHGLEAVHREAGVDLLEDGGKGVDERLRLAGPHVEAHYRHVRILPPWRVEHRRHRPLDAVVLDVGDDAEIWMFSESRPMDMNLPTAPWPRLNFFTKA